MGAPAKPDETRRSELAKTLALGAALCCALLIAYAPALRAGFIWDDDAWTLRLKPLFQDGGGLRAIWTDWTAMQQYYPLTGTTFWLDYQLWKFSPLPYHVENLVLHGLSVFLFRRVLVRLRIAGAWYACALFALHPLMVESVAWITERKNVLSMALGLAACLFYFGATDLDAPAGAAPPAAPRRAGRYALAWLLFTAALLAKTTVCCLPAAFLLLAWWKRGRLGFRRDVLPTLPFFAVALAMCAVTAWLEKHHAGAHGPDYALSFPERLLVAGRAFWFYVAQLLWPAKLAFSYPRWSIDAARIGQWLYPLAVLVLFGVLVRARGRLGRGPLAAALFFLGALFPLLGFVDVYYMRYAFVCDHWAYLPSLGPFALAGVGLATLAKRLGAGWLPRAAPAGVLLLALGALTRRQTVMYADAETLWRATLERNPSSWFAHNNLGNTLFRQGRVDDAMAEFDSALRLKPDLPEAHTSLGVARASRGDLVAAIASFRQAIRLKDDYAEPHFDLGLAFERMGEPDAAAAQYREALRLKPSLVVAQRRLSALERRAGQGR